MKKKSKLTVALTAGALCLSMLSVNPIFAADTGDNPTMTVDVKSKKQLEAEVTKNTALTDYKIKREKELEQFKATKEALSAGKITISAVSGQKEIAVPSFKQEKSFWCGPATTKQMLHFLNGSSLTQAEYAKKLGTVDPDGTDFSVVDNVLNANQTKVTYIYYQVPTSDDFSTRIDSNIDVNVPTALDLKITPANMPKYTETVEGHILNTSGYDYIYASTDELRLTDPFDQGNRGVTLGNVWHPYSGVYKANQAHFRKAIIW